jgi:SpoVK/Ycf46/Vps4 family AAA+-type ATPase
MSDNVSGDEVVKALQRALADDPHNVAVRLHLAELMLGQGDAAGALGEVAPVVAADPGNATARELLTKATAALNGSGGPAGGDLAEVVRLHAVPVPATDGSPWEVERPGITLADVGGMEKVKARLRASFLAPLRNPALRRMYGKSLRGGLLMWGPPGCGKTFIARAIAGELGARFVPVGLDDVLGLYYGESERNLHSIFETARRNTPCVLFLDEIDALGHKRSQLRGTAGHNLVVQLLDDLDGVDSVNEGVFVLAATNQPWDVDPALRRPGRFDRTMLVLPPDREARRAILSYHLRERPIGDDVDVDMLAAATDGFSGADLALVCEEAAEAALTRALETGDALPIGMSELRAAVAAITPSTNAWLHTAKIHAQFSGEGGSYDDLLAYLRGAGG